MERYSCLVLLLCLLAGCAAPVVQADLMAPVPSETVTASPTPTVAATSTPTLTPTATATPTSIPTIVIPILTQTVTPTIALAEAASPLMVSSLPERVVPEPFGVNIHFTRALPGELSLLSAAGFGWVRMDMTWNIVEQEQGRYNFAEYDALVAAMSQRGIRIIFILDYGNLHYDSGFAPHSPEARAAFARFAATAARRYQGKGIIWEIWNEPNLDQFWGPQPNVQHYEALLSQTVAAIRRVDPTALIVAPGISGFDWTFLTALGDMGAFKKLDAVTVHPYGIEIPEDLGPHYVHLAALLHRCHPAWKIPVISSECGTTAVAGPPSEAVQARYLPRQWLVNLFYDAHLSIWYDWRNNGVDPADIQHNFGVVRYDFSTKPAYYAAQTLLTTLAGYRFMRRIPLEEEDDYLLLFLKEDQAALALWTRGEAHTICLPLMVDEAVLVEMLGARSTLSSAENGLDVEIDGAPRYLLFHPQQVALDMVGWRPYETLQPLRAGEGYSVHVVFEAMPVSTFGQVQVWVQDEMRGTAEIVTRPMEARHVRIPVDVTDLKGNVPAELVFVPPDGTLLPLQRASIWLLLGE